MTSRVDLPVLQSGEQTLKDTMVHIMTLCDGVLKGVYMLGWLERNLEGDTKLKSSVVISPSYAL